MGPRTSIVSSALLALAACSSPASPDAGAAGAAGATGADAGDSGPLVVEAVEYSQDTLQFEPLADGDPIRLVRPPQGGHVVFVGARVKNLDTDTIDLTGRIRDATTGAILQEDTRTVKTEAVPGQPGWRQCDHRSYSQVSNIALCPDYDAKDIVGQELVLEVEVTELYAQGSTGMTSLHVVGACSQTDPAAKALCECECTGGYTLGRCPAPTKSDAGP